MPGRDEVLVSFCCELAAGRIDVFADGSEGPGLQGFQALPSPDGTLIALDGSPVSPSSKRPGSMTMPRIASSLHPTAGTSVEVHRRG